MSHVLALQIKRLIKQPALVLMFLGLTVLFVYFMGGAQIQSSMTVPVYSETLSEAEFDEWIEKLNVDDSIVFEKTEFEIVDEEIRMNEASFALEMDEGTYRFFAGREDERLSVVAQHVAQIFREETQLAQAREDFPDRKIEVQDFLTVNVEEDTQVNIGYSVYQVVTLVGFTFYFSVYSIMFMQINLIEEKKIGTWNRIVFSPVSKTQMYLGHLLFYFLIGIVQASLSFIILINLLGLDLGTNYLPIIISILAFLFVIVALGLLISALLPNSQSLQVVIPIVATAMAMLGGAFWPLDIVSNPILLFIAELMPIKHGIDAVIQSVFENASVVDLAQPLGILLLMGVIFMGVGINLMERQAEN